MNNAEPFKEMASKCGPSCKKEECVTLELQLNEIEVNLDNADVICSGLNYLRYIDSVRMLADKWPDIPDQTRHIFLRWVYSGDNLLVCNKCISLSSLLLSHDMSTAVVLLDELCNRTRKSPALKDKIKNTIVIYWLKRAHKTTPYPYESMKWESIDRANRLMLYKLFLYSLNDEVKAKKHNVLQESLNDYSKWLYAALLQENLTDDEQSEFNELAARKPINEVNDRPLGTQPTGSLSGKSEKIISKTIVESTGDTKLDQEEKTAVSTFKQVKLSDKKGPDPLKISQEYLNKIYLCMEQLAKERDSFQNQLNALQKEKEDLAKRTHSFNLSEANLKQEIENACNRIQQLESTLRQSDIERDRLITDVKTLNNSVESKEHLLKIKEEELLHYRELFEQHKEDAIEKRHVAIENATRRKNEEISKSIAHIVHEYKEWQSNPNLPDSLSHIKGLLDSLLAALRTNDIFS